MLTYFSRWSFRTGSKLTLLDIDLLLKIIILPWKWTLSDVDSLLQMIISQWTVKVSHTRGWLTFADDHFTLEIDPVGVCKSEHGEGGLRDARGVVVGEAADVFRGAS